ncbi:MAG: hypothetical protein V7K40_03600 [Nostoc sp.]|uniref:hypothetical protein n=1 Tax=Nostoc sp. TaxID=1180 RepID=UPI002FF686D6
MRLSQAHRRHRQVTDILVESAIPISAPFGFATSTTLSTSQGKTLSASPNFSCGVCSRTAPQPPLLKNCFFVLPLLSRCFSSTYFTDSS